MIWALMTLGVYLFHEKMKPVHWMLLGVLTVGVYAATMTRTTFLIMAATLVLAFVMDKSSKIREGSVVYIGGMAAVAAGFVFSLYAAHISNWYELMPAWVVRIDRILTGKTAAACSETGSCSAIRTMWNISIWVMYACFSGMESFRAHAVWCCCFS